MRFILVAMAFVIAVPIGAVFVGSTSGQQTTTRDERVAWVGEALKRMQTIRVGMTRRELLVVFTTEGGLSTPLRRRFVSRDCPYFKVDVQFDAVGRPSRDQEGRMTMVEGEQDLIVQI